MAHRQLDTCYQGTRYEYATTLSLSAISSVVQVPRPEDYGFDQICTLVEVDEQLRYPRKTFGVQTKPKSQRSLIFGGVDKKGEQKTWEIQWLFGRDIPLIISLVDLDPFCIKLYSTWNIWHAYWMSPQISTRQVTLDIGNLPPNDDDARWKSYPEDSNSYEKCTVYLGLPIVQLDSPLPDSDNISALYECLNFWVNLDWINLQFRKLGVPFMYTVKDWETNRVPNLSNATWQFWNKYQGIRDNLLRTLSPMITALEVDFTSNNEGGNIAKLSGIKEILNQKL